MRDEPDNTKHAHDHVSVGATLRAMRQQKNMSLQVLAKKSGVSTGMISQVERGLANPSMRVLTALRRALNISMQQLFGEIGAPALPPGDPPFVRRAKDRPEIDLESLHKELLTSGGRHNLQLMILRFEPGGHSGGRTISYPAEKAGLVLKGEITLSVDGNEAILSEGDSFVFDSARPHSIRNDSKSRADLLWVIGAVQFDRHL